MLEKFLKQTSFSSQEDFVEHFQLTPPENFNFAYDVVDEWARIDPKKRAMLWVNDKGEEHTFTFADMKKYSDQVASFLLEKGIKKGDMVMLILKRRYEFWFAILALHKIGAVVIPATHMLTAKDIEYRCQVADIKAIVCVGDAIVTKRVQDAWPNCPSLEMVFSTGPIVPEKFQDFQEFANAKPFVRPEFVNENSDLSLLYFTSGTTSHPKMVVHDFLYPLGHIVTGSFWHNLTEESLHLTIADTGWGKAVWGKLYGQWIAGATVFVYDHEKFTPREMLRMISKYRINSFCAPPTVFRFMLREKIADIDISCLKWCTIAGEALNPSVYEAFYKATGIRMREGFGQTETTCTILTTPWMTPKPGSMGKPNPAYDVDLVDENGKSVPPGVQGEIIIRIDPKNPPLGLFRGYYRDEQLTKRAYSNNIYYTGDVATRDADGYYWFVGRNDDVIKSSGYRIGPFEVESAVMSHPAVVECAITGVPDPIRGQAIKATIVLTKEYREHPENFENLKREIQDHVKRETAPYKYPRIVEFVDELPKTISGKIRRVDLRQKVEAFVEKVVPASMKGGAKEIVGKLPLEEIDKTLENTKTAVNEHFETLKQSIGEIAQAVSEKFSQITSGGNAESGEEAKEKSEENGEKTVPAEDEKSAGTKDEK